MLSDEDRKRIELDAAARVRAQWGQVSPRALGDVVAEVRVRMQEGTWGQRSFADQIDDIARMAHAKDVFARDEASTDKSERAAKGPELGD